MELRFLRDTQGREVDFVVMQKRKPLFAVECKVKEQSVDPALRYFSERVGIKRYFQVHLGEEHFERGPITVVPFSRFCDDLEMP